jgi:hypothetical protein
MVLPAIRKSYLKLLLSGILFLLCFGYSAYSQSPIDSILQPTNFQNLPDAIAKRASSIEERITKKNQKTLARLQRQEEKIYHRMLRSKDSITAKAALAHIKNKYQRLQDKLKSASSKTSTQYIAKLDTLTSVLRFLDGQGKSGKVKDALAKARSLQAKFQQAEDIKAFIRERKQQLKEQLENLGLAKQLKKFNKQAYYYSVQIKEYAGLLNNSKKAERKALELLSKTKLFKDFMRRSSQLASLFRLPGDPNDPVAQNNLAGLQTRIEVNNLIQQQLAAGGANAQQQFRQNVESAQSQLNQLKDKVIKTGGNGSDDMMPDGFKPNDQKTKNFWNRLELGTNIQTQKATQFFPVTSDIGLSIGYKLNDKSIIGVGASYKMGLGKGWDHIKVSHEGVGLRSFLDWKIKGSFWISGGYEMNYKAAFHSFTQLQNLNA